MATISPEQDGNRSELDKIFVVGQELVVAGGDTAELLQLVEEALDEVAFLVEDLVVRPSLLSVPLGRNDRVRSGVVDGLVQMVSVVSLVGDHGLRVEACDQLVAAGGIMALTWPEQQAHRVAEHVRGRVDLGAQPAVGAVQSLSIRPPWRCAHRPRAGGRARPCCRSSATRDQRLPSAPQESGLGHPARSIGVATLDGLMVTEAVRQVAPACTGTGHLQQRIDEQPVVAAWPALALAPTWNQITQPVPSIVAQPVYLAARHGRPPKSALNHAEHQMGISHPRNRHHRLD